MVNKITSPEGTVPPLNLKLDQEARKKVENHGVNKTQLGPQLETTTSFQTTTPPPSTTQGGHYQDRNLSGLGPNSMLSVRSKTREPEFKHPESERFAGLIREAQGQTERPQAAAANELLDAVKDHLGGREKRVNRSGQGAEMLSSMPTSERVPLLRRAIHALRQATKDGILPSRDLDILRQLSKVSQALGWNFDFDDNIVNMDTELVLFNKKDGTEQHIKTDEFAVIRDKLGKEGKWADFEVRGDSELHGSFRNFRDLNDPGVFERDLEEVMESPGWRGPSFSAFQRAMASEETAKWSTIITARGHYPNTIHAALEGLKAKGIIRHVLPEENVFPVSLPGLADRLGGGTTQSPSEAKVRVMEQYLDKIQEAPLGPSSQLIVPPDGGREKRHMHLWGFSDDDHGTFKKTVEILGKEVAKGRWPDVKITVFFTGQNHPEVEPHSVIIQPNGEPRSRLPTEHNEVDRVIERIAAYQKSIED